MVNYNGKEVTLQAVASLRRMTYPAFDLVVLDNASTDGSPEALGAGLSRPPAARAWRATAAARPAMPPASAGRSSNGYDYVLLLNNDIEVEPDMLDRLVRGGRERSPRSACVGPKCYFHGDRQRLWSAGGMLRFRESITHERGYGEIDRGQYDRTPRWTTSTAAPS